MWNGISLVISTNKDVTSICDSGLPRCKFLGCSGEQKTRGAEFKNVTVLHNWAGSGYLPEAGHYLLFSRSVSLDSLWPLGLQHARLPCPSPFPGAWSNSCLSIQWCHPTISSPVVPFSSCPQSFPASGSFLMSQLFASGGQSIGASASASVLPKNIQDWFPLGLTGLISLQSKGLSRVFSNITVLKHQRQAIMYAYKSGKIRVKVTEADPV